MGPGTYDQYKAVFKARANTASFATNRKDLLFSGNNNPGPQQYGSTAQNQGFQAKNWSTNIGAFGTTERKFAGLYDNDRKASVPGPGTYASQTFVQKKFTTKKMRGQAVRVKNGAQSSFFSSCSTRTFDDKLESNIKFHWPAAGQYETNKSSLGSFKLQGGAPNNFLLLKNTKSAAPFTSTVPRFQEERRHQSSLGPGQYSTNNNFDMSLDGKNVPETLFPGQCRS